MRTDPLHSAEIDAAGKVYVVWQDCRFRAGCTVNDLVLTTSTDGVSWTPVTRVPIDPVTSTVDHIIPGLGVDRETSGAGAKLGLTYYFNRNTCTRIAVPARGRLRAVPQRRRDVDATRSTSPGRSATTGSPITGLGRMVGDYISTSWMNGRAWPAFAIASAPTGPVFDEPIAVPTGGLTTTSGCQPGPAVVGCWHLDELAGTTAADASAATNDGTYLGGTTLGASGVFNTAASLDGANDLVSVPDDNSLDVGSSFSLEGWIKRSSTSKTHSMMIKANAFQLVVMNAGSGSQVYLRKPNVTTLARSEGAVPADGAYHHIVATIDGNGATAKIYIDGVPDTVTVSSPQTLVNTTFPLTFGGPASTEAKFDEFADLRRGADPHRGRRAPRRRHPGAVALGVPRTYFSLNALMRSA